MKVYVLTHIDCTPSVHLSFEEAALQATYLFNCMGGMTDKQEADYSELIKEDGYGAFSLFQSEFTGADQFHIEESEIDLSSIINKIEMSSHYANVQCKTQPRNITFGDTNRISTDVHYGMVEAFDEVLNMLVKLNRK